MSDDLLELKKAKIDSLVSAFTNSGYKSTNRIGQTELFQFLSKRTSSGSFDNVLSEKLFQVLNLDHMSTMTVEDFINGWLQFEEDLGKNFEAFNIKLNQEREIYSKLDEQCKRYKYEKLNSEGLCENAKVYGEITDIDIKRKLEGIKEIIIKVIYNDKTEELHFKIGDINANEMLKKSFGFKPTSRKDHFEFIMKGINDRNQVFDIGSKVFPLNEINSHEEYIVEIVIPEIDNEEQIAAYIHAKIVLYWNDYKYFEKLRRKSESRLKKLMAATSKAEQYLKFIREIYGDLTRKKADLIVDFNNEKLMQRKGGKLNVNFNNQKEAEAPGGNFLVEFNNSREVEKAVEPAKIEIKKEVIEETKVKETVPQTKTIETTIKQQHSLPYITKVVDEPVAVKQESIPYITKIEEHHQNIEYTYPVQQTDYTYKQQIQTETNILPAEQSDYIYTEQVQTNTNVWPTEQTDYTYTQQVQTETNTWPVEQTDYTYTEQAQNETNYNVGQEYNVNDYYNQQSVNSGEIMTTTTTTTTVNQNGGDMRLAETIGYGSSDNIGNVEAYGTGGLEYIDNNPPTATLRDSKIVKEAEIRTSVNKAMFNESTNKTLFSQTTLPVKVYSKVNEVIFDKNVKTLPIIFGGKSVVYDKENKSNTLNMNNSSEKLNQAYTLDNHISNAYETNYSVNI